MKNLETILVAAILFIGFQSSAQSIVDGKYSTTFGNISMTTEFDKEFPNGSLIYGDYRENGTISGYYADFQKEIKGTFFNGSSEGKFIFMMPFLASASNPVTSMNGFWGYTSDNKNSTNSGNQWNVTAKTGTNIDTKNVTNVWSGTWNTTDGKMHLIQVGKNITGRYKGLGTVAATYNPLSRLLKGTFKNLNNNKTGYIEFYFEGNTFKGKWGWTAAMTEGNWDGTKEVKNNKELSKMVVSASQPTASTSNSSVKMVKYRINLTEIDVPYFLFGTASNPLINLYGFVGVRFYRVTSNGKSEIKSFGNKPFYFFEKDENNAFSQNRENIDLPDTPSNYRDFEFLESDINNPNIDIEVELWHHLKAKIPGKNNDYGKTRQTLTIERLIEVQKVKNEINIGANCSNGILQNRDNSYVTFKLKQISN